MRIGTSDQGRTILDCVLEHAAQQPSVRGEISRELEALLAEVNAGLADYEKLQMLVVVSEPWSIENGCLTPTMKVKRARIEATVAPHLDDWYARRASVLRI